MSYFYRVVAKQLAKPSGILGRIVARWMRHGNSSMNDKAFSLLDPQAEDRILEVGFGGGELISRIIEGNSMTRVAGVDISADMVKRARRRFSEDIRVERLAIELAPADKLPFPDTSFNKVCSVNTVYFWEAPGQILREVRRVLMPGGFIVLVFDDHLALQRWPGHRHGFHLHTASEIRQMLVDAGFGNVQSHEGKRSHGEIFHAICASKRVS